MPEGVVDIKEVATLFKALGDETRLKILHLLAGQELCVCEIMDALKMSQSAVSHHLKILKQARLVDDRREAKWIFYSINGSVWEEHWLFLEQLFGSRPPEGKQRSYEEKYTTCERLEKSHSL